MERFHLSAPVMGWVSAANFRLVMDKKKQTDKYVAKLEKSLSAKDKKRLKAEAAEKKRAEKAAAAEKKKREKEDKDAAKRAEREEAERRRAMEAAAAAPPAEEAEAARPKSGARAECYGAWVAKGDSTTTNKVRRFAAMDSMVVGKVLGGQKVNVTGEAAVKHADGHDVSTSQTPTPRTHIRLSLLTLVSRLSMCSVLSSLLFISPSLYCPFFSPKRHSRNCLSVFLLHGQIRRLEINAPKAGFVSASNFTQLGKDGKPLPVDNESA